MQGAREEEPALDVAGLTKLFRGRSLGAERRPALDRLTIRVPRREVFGYLGPNGAGKTTTLKLLLGLLAPDAGSVRLLGWPASDRASRQRLGYLPESPYFYDYLTAREYLEYAGRLFGLKRSLRKERSKELLELVGLARRADMPLRRYSKGMLQRLGLAQALVNDPDLVFLDEPMSGLDPLGRRFVRELILKLKERGRTVFFSTHVLSDAESLCDRVGLLRDGRLTAVGRLDEILNIDVAHLEVLVSGVAAGFLEQLPAGARISRAMGERWALEVAEGSLGTVVRAVEDAAGRVLSVQPIRQSLEDYFVSEMNRGDAQAWHAVD